MTEWFTSDWHFYHPAIIGYCDRPYKTEKAMRKDIIERYNSVVAPEDTVYVVGDVGMLGRDKLSKLRPILEKMNGTKHLILGNHDEGKPFTYERMGFTTVHTALQLNTNGPNNEPIYIRHDPAACNVAPEAIWIVGHVHNLFHYTTKPMKCFNVGVDLNDFYPVKLQYIIDTLYAEEELGSETIRENVKNMTEEERTALCDKCNAEYEGNEPKNCTVFNVYGVCKYLADSQNRS